MESYKERADKALELIVRYGGIDGDHHKAWVLDQVCRILTGCQEEDAEGIDAHGHVYRFTVLGESEEYKALVREACDGEDGPETYGWDEGTRWDKGTPP
jgi:hypothetical protein